MSITKERQNGKFSKESAGTNSHHIQYTEIIEEMKEKNV